MSAQLTDAPTTFQNPFLDPFTVPQGGRLAGPGQPLNRLQIPDIHTLIRKEATAGNLAMVNVTEALARVTPRENFVVRDETVGIELNLALFGTAMTAQTPGQTTPVELQTGQFVGRIIPTSYQEARQSLHLITPQRTGSRNVAYNINELRRIARNLDLPANGNKDVLANRIRTAVIEFYNLQDQ